MEVQRIPLSAPLLLAFTISTLYILISFIRRSGHSIRRRLPPSPPAWPVIGHLHLIRSPPHRSFHALAERYGPDLLSLRLGSTSCIVVTSAQAARELLKTHDIAVANRPLNMASRRFYGGTGFAFTPYGQYLRFLRRLCTSQLLGGCTLEQLRPVRRQELQKLLHGLQKKSVTKEPSNLSLELLKMTNAVVVRMTTGAGDSVKDAAEIDDILYLVKGVSECIGSFNLADFIGFCKIWDVQGIAKKIEDVFARFDCLLERIIKEREEFRRREVAATGGGASGMKGFIDIMLEIAEDDCQEIKLTKENIKGFCLDIFTAGSDSSAATVEWALAELVNNPTMLKKAQVEIDEVIGMEKIVEESDIANLPFLQAVVKETLRLHPAAPFALRKSSKDISVCGYDIPEGVTMFVSVWSINRDPKHWENPLAFQPERFLDSDTRLISDGLDYRGQNFHYLPFGSGRRICPGTNLAMLMVQTTLGALIQCFDWNIDGDHGKKLNMDEGDGVVVPRLVPFVCVPVVRNVTFPTIQV